MRDMMLEREMWQYELQVLNANPRNDFQLGALWWQLTKQEIDEKITRALLLKKLKAEIEGRIHDLTDAIEDEKEWVRVRESLSKKPS
jgi:hypothetical protein